MLVELRDGVDPGRQDAQDAGGTDGTAAGQPGGHVRPSLLSHVGQALQSILSNANKVRMIALYIQYRDGVPDEDRRRLYQHARLSMAEQDAVNALLHFGVRVTKVRGLLSWWIIATQPRHRDLGIKTPGRGSDTSRIKTTSMNCRVSSRCCRLSLRSVIQAISIFMTVNGDTGTHQGPSGPDPVPLRERRTGGRSHLVGHALTSPNRTRNIPPQREAELAPRPEGCECPRGGPAACHCLYGRWYDLL